MNIKFVKRLKLVSLVLLFSMVLSTQVNSAETIAGYKVAKESVLRTIPTWAIAAAKNKLHILYCGTSHSTQVVDGMRGLMQYKAGDDTLFAYTYNGVPVAGKLDIHYNGANGTDLSHDSVDANGHTEYFTGTVDYLDTHSDVNVVMWSWCSIEGHNVQIYLNNFAELINMYKAGGTKGRTAENAVQFVFMTGYAAGGDGDTPEPPYTGTPYQNYKRITDYCKANNYFCLDYWSQDTYHYETDAYKPTESGNDNEQHKAYFDSHTQGVDWFATRSFYNGSVEWPAHCEGTPQHITSNRRAYAAWWIFARLAGWNGSPHNKTDFNNDNQTDILWRHYLNGKNTIWYMNNNVRTSYAALTIETDLNWTIAGTGDFNNDGKVDILWRNTSNGQNKIWYMNNTAKSSETTIKSCVDVNWEVAGLADFNQDGKIDILWRNYSNGKNIIWYMNNSTYLSCGSITAVTDLDWHLAAAADFNNDGKPDLLWRHGVTGKNIVWYMNNNVRTNYAVLKVNTDLNWEIAYAADFNNDNQTDILWRNTSNGENRIWYFNGATYQSSAVVSTVLDNNWKIAN